MLSPKLQRVHDAAQARGEPGYIDPESGLFVMTAKAHLDRGHCCGTGCRHCPYPPAEQARAGRSGRS